MNAPVMRANVLKAGVPAATLTRTRAGVEFRYLSEYRARGAVPVASTLPLTEAPLVTQAGAVPPFFAGLLPEGRRLGALRRSIKASVDDELSLLAAVGGDTVGDVQVFAEGSAQEATDPVLELPADPSLVRFRDFLTDSGVVDPVALSGVQDKISGRMISVPAARAGERFIIKFNPPEYPHVVENEAFFLGLAKAARMRVVGARLIYDGNGMVGLAVKRFDRVARPDGSAVSLAVEDGAQALNLWPADKYNTTFRDVSHALMGLCGAPVIAAREIFRQLVFAILTGNGDLHAKNLSVMTQADGEVVVTPAYDLPSTIFYGDSTLALSIDGVHPGFSRRILLSLADDLGLAPKAAAKIIDDQLAATAGLGERLLAGALPFGEQTTRTVVLQLRNRRRLLEGR